MSNTQLLTDCDVADLLRVPAVRVLRFAKQNKIPHLVLPAGEIRFIESEVWAWLESQRPSVKSNDGGEL